MRVCVHSCLVRYHRLSVPSTLQAVAYEYNTEFSQVLAQRTDFYSSDPAADTINRVRGEISQVNRHRAHGDSVCFAVGSWIRRSLSGWRVGALPCSGCLRAQGALCVQDCNV